MGKCGWRVRAGCGLKPGLKCPHALFFCSTSFQLTGGRNPRISWLVEEKRPREGHDLPRVTVLQQWPAKASQPGRGSGQIRGGGEESLVWVAQHLDCRACGDWKWEGVSESGQWQNAGWALRRKELRVSPEG